MTKRTRSFPILAAVVFAGIFATSLRAMTIETIDDKTTTGNLSGVEGEELVLLPKTTGQATPKIPLRDIVAIQFSWQDRQAHLVIPTTLPASTLPASTQAAATTVPAVVHKATKWRVELGAGDHVLASLNQWTETRVSLGLDSDISLVVPVEQVRAVWSNVAFQVKKAKDLKMVAQAQDIAFVEKDGEVKGVAGLAAGIESGADGDFLKFKFEGEERKIKMDRLVGLMLAQREPVQEKGLFATFDLVNGDVISGKIQGLGNGSFQVVPLAAGDGGAAVEVSLATITKIEMHNGRLAWVTDLTPSAVSQAAYFDRLMPYQVNQSLTGGPLVMAEGTVGKGIAVHSRCVLTYGIEGVYERFKGKVGFQEPEGKMGRAAVRVIGDGKVLWEEGDLRGDAKSTALDVGVTGVKELVLEVDYGKNEDVGDRVIWGEPRLIKPAN